MPGADPQYCMVTVTPKVNGLAPASRDSHCRNSDCAHGLMNRQRERRDDGELLLFAAVRWQG